MVLIVDSAIEKLVYSGWVLMNTMLVYRGTSDSWTRHGMARWFDPCVYAFSFSPWRHGMHDVVGVW